MIETLVALFILAIGLLGVIAMQVNSVKSNQRAMYSGEVTLLASDMIDRIYAHDDVDIATDNTLFAGLKTSDGTCSTAGCDTEMQAAFDAWTAELKSRLPLGRGKVTAANSIYTLTVMWDNDNSGSTGENCGGDPTVDLSCYAVEFRL